MRTTRTGSALFASASIKSVSPRAEHIGSLSWSLRGWTPSKIWPGMDGEASSRDVDPCFARSRESPHFECEESAASSGDGSISRQSGPGDHRGRVKGLPLRMQNPPSAWSTRMADDASKTIFNATSRNSLPFRCSTCTLTSHVRVLSIVGWSGTSAWDRLGWTQL